MSNALSAIQAVGAIFAGYGALTLGPVSFQDIELPKSMSVGGTQEVNSHRLPGGGKTVDIMGAYDADQQWSGVFYGQDASTRIRLVDSIRQSGQVVTLAWDVFSYQVIVTAFKADTRANDAMPYQITCCVVQNNSSPRGQTLTTLSSQVVADLSQGQPLAALGAISNGAVAGPVGSALTAVGAPAATTIGSAAYKAATQAVNTASQALNTTLGNVNIALAGYGVTLGGLANGAPDIRAAIAGITGSVSATGDCANLLKIRGYVGRAGANLLNASA